MRKYIYRIGAFLAGLPLLAATASCEDWFEIMPQSEMVAEDFWKDEQDVESAVGACYRAMLEDGFMRRLIVWGELRSDNVVNGTSSDTEIGYILNANLTESNSYCKWNDFYTVINYCNTVLQNAPAVRERDADFTEADLNHYIAEVKGIRAFCYFTLARAFKDIPYIETAYVDDTQRFQVPQTPFENVLDTLIRDLKTVENLAVTTYGDDNIEYTRGRITQKAIWALIADMSLWRGDYQQCVDYCDKILTTSSNPLSLLPAETYFNEVFFTGNSDESIWELQFDYNTQNGAVRTFYGDANNSCLLSAFSLETYNGQDWWNGIDMRRIGSYAENSGTYHIMKGIRATYSTNYENIGFGNFTSYNNGQDNWIIYRLADVYLMKAEALVEDGDASGAVDMLSYTYDRAHPNLDPGTLKEQYGTSPVTTVRDLVLDERQREFLFEGKRYFDLVRRILREGTATNVINNYILRKYTSGMGLSQSTVMSKINDVNSIFMPIHQDELRLNHLLNQNPFYEISDDISKN